MPLTSFPVEVYHNFTSGKGVLEEFMQFGTGLRLKPARMGAPTRSIQGGEDFFNGAVQVVGEIDVAFGRYGIFAEPHVDLVVGQ